MNLLVENILVVKFLFRVYKLCLLKVIAARLTFEPHIIVYNLFLVRTGVLKKTMAMLGWVSGSGCFSS